MLRTPIDVYETGVRTPRSSGSSVSRPVSGIYVTPGTFALQSSGGSRRVRPGLDPGPASGVADRRAGARRL